MAALPVTTVGLGAVEMVFPDRESLSADASAFFSMDLAMVRSQEDLPPGSVWDVAIHLPWTGATLSLTGRSSRRLREGWLLEVTSWRSGHRERLWASLDTALATLERAQSIDEDATLFRSTRPGMADDLNPRPRPSGTPLRTLKVAAPTLPARFPPPPPEDEHLEVQTIHRFKANPRSASRKGGPRTETTSPPTAGSWGPPMDADETIFRSNTRTREAIAVLPVRQVSQVRPARVRPPKRRAQVKEKVFDHGRHLDHSDWEGVLTRLEGGVDEARHTSWMPAEREEDFSEIELELLQRASGYSDWGSESAMEIAPLPERRSAPPVEPPQPTKVPLPVVGSQPQTTTDPIIPRLEPGPIDVDLAPRSTTPSSRAFTSATPPPVPREFRREAPVAEPPRTRSFARVSSDVNQRPSRSLADRGVALVLLDHHLAERSGWMEVSAAGVVRRLRLHQGEVIDFEQLPTPSLKLFETAAHGVGLSWAPIAKHTQILGRNQPEEALALAEVLTRRQAAQLLSRRVSLQLARLLAEGWRGELYFEESQSRVTLLPEPRVPIVRLVWDTLRARCFEARPGAIRRQLRFVGRTGFVWDGRAQFPVDEAQLRVEEQAVVVTIQQDPIGVAAQLVAGQGRADLVTLATFWCLLMVGQIVPQHL